MVALYGGILLGGLLFARLRYRLKPPHWSVLGLMTAPMILDGITHWISDLAGPGRGFRDDNVWLATLTGNLFPPAFYAGNALGSFNSWMRIVTGLLFGLAVVWLVYPFVETYFRSVCQALPATRGDSSGPIE